MAQELVLRTLVREDVVLALKDRLKDANLAANHFKRTGVVMRGGLAKINRDGRLRIGTDAEGENDVRLLEYDAIYRFGKETPGIGRLYESNGVQSTKGELRRHLFNGVGVDVDMVNSQPVILVQFAAVLGYAGEFPHLKEYLDERDAWLVRVHPERKVAKQLFLSIMFGGAIGSWERLNETKLDGDVRTFLEGYEQEISQFAAWFMDECDASEPIKEQCTLEGSARHKRYRVLSLALQDEERKCLEAAVRALLRGGGRALCLLHDGMIVQFGTCTGDQEDTPGPIDSHESIPWRGRPIGAGHWATNCAGLSHAALLETGYHVAFELKQCAPIMSLEQLEREFLTDQGPSPALLRIDVDGENSDAGDDSMIGTQRLVTPPPQSTEDLKDCDMEALDDFISYFEESLGWDEAGQIWHWARPGAGGIKGYSIARAGLWVQGPPPASWWLERFGGASVYSVSGKKRLTMCSLLAKHVATGERLGKWERYGKHEFPVLSGVLDLLTGEVRAYTPQDHAIRKLDFDPYWLEHGLPTEEAIANGSAIEADLWNAECQEMLECLGKDNNRVYAEDPDLMLALEQRFAYACFERGNRLKMMVNMIGTKGNNGKSSLGIRVKACFGQSFVGALDASSLSKRTAAGAPNSALANARTKNLLICEEGGVSDRLNAGLCKELSGGTDWAVRDLNQRQAADCSSNATIFCISNQALPFDHPDEATDARMLRLDLPSRLFKSEEDRDAAIQELSVHEQLRAKKTMHLRDETFNECVMSLPYRALYFAFLVNRYREVWIEQGGKPLAVPEAYAYQSDEARMDENSLEAIMEDLFEVTGCAEDELSTKAIAAHIRTSRPKAEINTIALGRHLTALVRGSDNKMTKKQRARMMTYSGIAKKQDENAVMPNYIGGGY